MTLVDYRNNASLYAEYYSRLSISGTQFLAFRDIPQLIKQYVLGTTTLDYGSGAGKSSLYLKSLGLNVDGVDINEDMINRAKDLDPIGKYKVINSAEIPIQDKYYDLVFSSWVLMEVSSKQELLKITQEVARILKVGGTFITVLCNKDTYNNDWLSENTQFEENKGLNSGSIVKIRFKEIDLTIYDYFWSDEDYCEVITKAGLTIVHTHNPIGKDSDGYAWVNEKEKSPCTIYIAKKLTEVS
ncbi:class I SAM-dependent methyltransferase [Candidatus Tisiphia endosymbiont of Ditula angustiorana]|uniref:class I SAM-dependent methyltransferase n=1 Tax=Candidatus Tisiphia endosymbiont of Ditula angustiorana TaxID=3066272 RepID=UPI00312C9B5A